MIADFLAHRICGHKVLQIHLADIRSHVQSVQPLDTLEEPLYKLKQSVELLTIFHHLDKLEHNCLS